MDKQEVRVYEPTEESFHDLSELGAEDILDLSSIYRDNVVCVVRYNTHCSFI